MNIDIPDELHIPLTDIARFAAEHGCWLESKWCKWERRLDLVMVNRHWKCTERKTQEERT